jgi:hypothetical protein
LIDECNIVLLLRVSLFGYRLPYIVKAVTERNIFINILF